MVSSHTLLTPVSLQSQFLFLPTAASRRPPHTESKRRGDHARLRPRHEVGSDEGRLWQRGWHPSNLCWGRFLLLSCANNTIRYVIIIIILNLWSVTAKWVISRRMSLRDYAQKHCKFLTTFLSKTTFHLKLLRALIFRTMTVEFSVYYKNNEFITNKKTNDYMPDAPCAGDASLSFQYGEWTGDIPWWNMSVVSIWRMDGWHSICWNVSVVMLPLLQVDIHAHKWCN